MDKNGPERAATKTRGHDLLRIIMGQKESPRLGGTDKSGPERVTETRRYDLLWIKMDHKSHQHAGARFDTNKSGPERANKTRGYDLLRIGVDQKEVQRSREMICYG